MAKNRNSSDQGMCQRIKSTFRRLSPTPPVHVVNYQPNFSKTIPIESEPTIAPSAVKAEIVIASGGNAGPRKGHHVRIEEAKTTKKHEGCHEDPDYVFSDYINKVKRRMLNTVSTVKGDFKSVTFKR